MSESTAPRVLTGLVLHGCIEANVLLTDDHDDVDGMVERVVEGIREYIAKTPDDNVLPNTTVDQPLDHEAGKHAYRTMEAIKGLMLEMYPEPTIAPNITMVLTMPPDAKCVVATTEPNRPYALMALQGGMGALHRMIRLQGEERA